MCSDRAGRALGFLAVVGVASGGHATAFLAFCGGGLAAAVELVPEESLMSVRAAEADVRIGRDQAGPDGGEGQEDAYDCDALRTELGDGVVELEACEDRWARSVQTARM